MKTTEKEKLWTYEEYLKLGEDKRYEIIGGELLEMPAPSIIHQRVVKKLLRKLDEFVEAKGVGEVFVSPVDVVLSEILILQPDIVFISEEKKDFLKEKSIICPPDLVVEVVSPSTFKRDVEDKRKLYAQHGIKEYWLVFPEEKVIEVLNLQGKEYEVYSYAYDKGKVCSKILEGFCVDLEEVFS